MTLMPINNAPETILGGIALILFAMPKPLAELRKWWVDWSKMRDKTRAWKSERNIKSPSEERDSRRWNIRFIWALVNFAAALFMMGASYWMFMTILRSQSPATAQHVGMGAIAIVTYIGGSRDWPLGRWWQ